MFQLLVKVGGQVSGAGEWIEFHLITSILVFLHSIEILVVAVTDFLNFPVRVWIIICKSLLGLVEFIWKLTIYGLC
jgi:hypothetical protein